MTFKFDDVPDSNGYFVTLWKVDPVKNTNTKAFTRFFFSSDTIKVELPTKGDYIF